MNFLSLLSEKSTTTKFFNEKFFDGVSNYFTRIPLSLKNVKIDHLGKDHHQQQKIKQVGGAAIMAAFMLNMLRIFHIMIKFMM